MWNGPAATTAAAPPNLARLIAPTLHRSWVVSCLLTKEGGREGGRRRRDIGLNSGWGGGLNGVICREFTLLTVTVILLRCWLTDSWLLLFFISWEDFRIQRGITRDWQRGTSEEFFFFFFSHSLLSIDYFPSEVSYIHPFSSLGGKCVFSGLVSSGKGNGCARMPSVLKRCL